MTKKVHTKSSSAPARRQRSYAEAWRQRWSGNLMFGLIIVILMLGLARC